MDKKSTSILISVDANATSPDSEKENLVHLVTTGELHTYNDTTTIKYHETLDEQSPPQNIELVMKDNSIDMNRSGEITTSMHFCKDQRYETQYNTPYGVFDLAIYCLKSNHTRTKNKGEIQICYNLEIDGVFSAKHEFRLRYIEKTKQ